MIDEQKKKCTGINKGTPCRKSSIEIRDLDEETILYSPATKHVHILNKTALLVWQLCDGQHSIADMAAAIAWTCSLSPGEKVENKIEQDIRCIINDFEAHGIVE